MPPRRKRTTEPSIPVPTKSKRIPEKSSIDKPRRTWRGKCRIEMKLIEDPVKRANTLCKRKKGLVKKAEDLYTLTGCECMFVMKSPSGRVYTYATPSFNAFVTEPSGQQTISYFIARGERAQDKLQKAQQSKLDRDVDNQLLRKYNNKSSTKGRRSADTTENDDDDDAVDDDLEQCSDYDDSGCFSSQFQITEFDSDDKDDELEDYLEEDEPTSDVDSARDSYDSEGDDTNYDSKKSTKKKQSPTDSKNLKAMNNVKSFLQSRKKSSTKLDKTQPEKIHSIKPHSSKITSSSSGSTTRKPSLKTLNNKSKSK